MCRTYRSWYASLSDRLPARIIEEAAKSLLQRKAALCQSAHNNRKAEPAWALMSAASTYSKGAMAMTRVLLTDFFWAGKRPSGFDLLDVGSSCFPGELIAGIRVANGTTDNEGCPASAYMPSCGLRHFLTPEIIMSAHG